MLQQLQLFGLWTRKLCVFSTLISQMTECVFLMINDYKSLMTNQHN